VSALHIDLDGAWAGNGVLAERLDATDWGPKLRFSAPPRLIEAFYREIQPRLSSFQLYGSGDFHHLTALWIRNVSDRLIVISFDNHPDWDVRPPRWACGGWVNRALELPNVERISVWGCGNFECWWPGQIFGNRRAEREGNLEVHPWADDRPPKDQARRGAILQTTWQSRFDEFVSGISGRAVYVTIDLDCLKAAEAVVNWESGRFTTADLEWALTRVRQNCRLVAGDICGAFSEPRYARRKQRFAAEFDHPKLTHPPVVEIRATNLATLKKLWPVLIS